jgi:single-stranded-DNA-specific exonuclease
MNATANPKILNRLLPLVAIGTIADCQSVLEPTNRMLVKAGLSILNSHQISNLGLQELIQKTGLAEKINSGYKLTGQDLGFVFSPILNASGRISHARESIALLLSDNLTDAESRAESLVMTNQQRKLMVKDILEEVELEAEKQFVNKQNLIWLEGSWSKGLVGLLASRLVNNFGLPVVVVSVEDEKASGSLRAPEGYHLPDAMSSLPEGLFIKKGGHPGAAGFSVKSKNLLEIKELFGQAILDQKQTLNSVQTEYLPVNFQSNLPDKINRLRYQKDLLWLKEADLTSEFIQDLVSLDPFGQDFPMPKIMIYLQNYGYKPLGKDGKHLRILTAHNSFTFFSGAVDNQEIMTEIKTEIGYQKYNLWLQLKVSQNSWQGQTKWEFLAENGWFVG